MSTAVSLRKNLASTYIDRGITVVRAEGVYLYGSDGKSYLDLMSNYGVNILGHGDAQVAAALHEQVDRLISLHGSLNNEQRFQATDRLLQAIGFDELTHVYWSNSGTEAVEAAVKFSVAATGRKKLMAAANGYHGKTLGSLALTDAGDGKHRTGFADLLPPVDFVPFGDIAELARRMTPEYAAFILEPIQGEGGVIVPPDDYLPAVSKICSENKVLLIVDEIQTGLGRTGSFLRSQAFRADGFVVDLLCLGKGLAGGVPVGATVIGAEVNRTVTSGLHTSTFGGNPLAMAGVTATLDALLTRDLPAQAARTGSYFAERLQEVQAKFPHRIDAVSACGLMIGVRMKDPATRTLKGLQRRGILAAPSSSDVVRFLPPLTIDRPDVDLAIEAMIDFFDAADAGREVI